MSPLRELFLEKKIVMLRRKLGCEMIGRAKNHPAVIEAQNELTAAQEEYAMYIVTTPRTYRA